MTLLIGLLAALAALQNAPGDEPAWTWTLYEGNDGPMVLAQEVPDTPRLAATFECAPGAGAARIRLYEQGAAAADGFAELKAGAATAIAQTRRTRERLETALPVDHPVFIAFQADGVLSLETAGRARRIVVERPHLPKLRRFAERCAG